MKKTTQLLVWLVALAVVIGGGLLVYNFLIKDNAAPEPQAPDLSEQTPDDDQAQQSNAAYAFTVYTAEVEPVALADFSGRPVIVNIWATWCGPCRVELPDFQNAYHEYGEQVEFLFVCSELPEIAQGYFDEQGFEMPLYYDFNNDITVNYAVAAVPMTILIDSNGDLFKTHIGMLTKDALDRLLDEFLAHEESLV